ncbi:MAG: PTS sugar transporter subunit IIA, partial [Clostridium sp.]
HVQDALCKNDILEKLVDLLVKKEYVSQEYLLDVYKREAMGATIMGKAAIPHGFTEHVTKPAIAILTLQDAILWEDDFETNIILMPALQEESIAYTQELFSICSDSTLIQALSACQKPQEIIRLIATTQNRPISWHGFCYFMGEG